MENLLVLQKTFSSALNFCDNWNYADLAKTFKESRLGSDYLLSKMKEKVNGFGNTTGAAVDFILNIDNKHQQMILDTFGLGEVPLDAGFTHLEVLHYTMLWITDYRIDDLPVMFANSGKSSNFYTNEFLHYRTVKYTEANEASVAYLQTLDTDHQQMFLNYILNVRFNHIIINRRTFARQLLELREKQK